MPLKSYRFPLHLLLTLLACASPITIPVASAQETLCAEVRIEILQELTLERQGFHARMALSNQTDTQSLEQVSITLSVTDEFGAPVAITNDPDDSNARFFVREDALNGIAAVDGNGVVAPNTVADIQWLIIPAPGSGGTLPGGKRYFVGATLNYTLASQPRAITVLPDLIQVKPQPQLRLDYFLTREIRADDPLTREIEPVEPFTLGVRVTNNGSGIARSIGIESAQPRIIENKQGLAIGFRVIGSTVNDQPATPSLTLNLGDIPPQSAAIGRWRMETDLAGHFESFSANFSHADELGGALTSLISTTSAHDLIHEVLADLPGRDRITDFLAQDGQSLQLYESSGFDAPVLDRSNHASLQAITEPSSGLPGYHLQVPPTTGFFHIKLADPQAGVRQPGSVLRADGKLLPAQNVWISRERQSDNRWAYSLNLFDVASNGDYTIGYQQAAPSPQAPTLGPITNHAIAAGQSLTFAVTALDANGNTPTLSASPLPDGASFTDTGTGSALFRWTPKSSQTGLYPVVFSASIGTLESTQAAVLRVCPAADSDCDGMDDAWELQYFGTLDRDGNGDFDGDGISDLDEFLAGSDPGLAPGPEAPAILQPVNDSKPSTLTPTLEVANSTHWPGTEGSYHFEVYTDADYQQMIAEGEISEQTDTTAWVLATPLSENTRYWWRARAYDGNLYSEWNNASFFVNVSNDPPGSATPFSPLDGTDVSTPNPTLKAGLASDPDQDLLNYRFQVSVDPDFATAVADSGPLTQDAESSITWTLDQALEENVLYYWRVITTDPDGATAASSRQSIFVNTVNDPPGKPGILSPLHFAQLASLTPELVISSAQDLDDALLTYRFELSTSPFFPEKQRIAESPPIATSASQIHWTPPVQLTDNTYYYWRARASDGFSDGPWASGFFGTDLDNQPPIQPRIGNLGDDAWVDTLTPIIHLISRDPDKDHLNFKLELYSDEALQQRLATLTTAARATFHFRQVGNIVLPELQDHQWYYWRVRAEDPRGLVSSWTPVQRFYVNDNQIDDPPRVSLPSPLRLGPNRIRVKWTVRDPDSNPQIDLYYSNDQDDAIAVPLATDHSTTQAGIQHAGTFDWDTTQLVAGRYRLFIITRDGSSTITHYTPHPIPIAPPTLRPSYGDVNGDGRIEWDDGRICRSRWQQSRQQSGISEIPVAATDLCDVRADGILSSGDITPYTNHLLIYTCAPFTCPDGFTP